MHSNHGRAHAAIYARVSTEDRGKGFSIPTQIDACQKLTDRCHQHSSGVQLIVS
jgi:hypothetical protein